MDSLLSVSRVVVESKLSTIMNQEIRESRMKSRDQVETCHKYSKSSLPCSRPCCNFYSDEFETMRISAAYAVRRTDIRFDANSIRLQLETTYIS